MSLKTIWMQKSSRFIKRNNKISTEKMGMVLGVSTRTILRRIKTMGNVHYIGRGFSGHWEVDDVAHAGHTKNAPYIAFSVFSLFAI